MKRTTIEKFDTQGRLLERTVTEEYDSTASTTWTFPYIYPNVTPYIQPNIWYTSGGGGGGGCVTS